MLAMMTLLLLQRAVGEVEKDWVESKCWVQKVCHWWKARAPLGTVYGVLLCLGHLQQSEGSRPPEPSQMPAIRALRQAVLVLLLRTLRPRPVHNLPLLKRLSLVPPPLLAPPLRRPLGAIFLGPVQDRLRKDLQTIRALDRAAATSPSMALNKALGDPEWARWKTKALRHLRVHRCGTPRRPSRLQPAMEVGSAREPSGCSWSWKLVEQGLIIATKANIESAGAAADQRLPEYP